MYRGYSKIWRKIIDTSFYTNPNMIRLAIHLLLTANHKKQIVFINGKNEIVDQGQTLTGTKTLAKELKLSRQQIRTAIDNLKTAGFLTSTVTNRFSIITILNYISYNNIDFESNQHSNQLVTSQQPASNQPVTTNNNDKSYKNDKNVIKKNKFLNPEEIRTICEDNLSQMATPKFIIPVLRQVPEGMWGNVLSFIMRRFPADNLGSKYYNESVKTLREEKQCQTKQR